MRQEGLGKFYIANRGSKSDLGSDSENENSKGNEKKTGIEAIRKKNERFFNTPTHVDAAQLQPDRLQPQPRATDGPTLLPQLADLPLTDSPTNLQRRIAIKGKVKSLDSNPERKRPERRQTFPQVSTEKQPIVQTGEGVQPLPQLPEETGAQEQSIVPPERQKRQLSKDEHTKHLRNMIRECTGLYEARNNLNPTELEINKKRANQLYTAIEKSKKHFEDLYGKK